MILHPPTLLFACLAVLLLAAVLMTWFGQRRPTYRGHGWWVASQWMLVGSLALQLMPLKSAAATAVAHALALQWPIGVVAGLRRFYSRHGLPLPAAADACVLGAAFAAALTSTVAGAGAHVQWLTWCAGPMFVHAYAAWLVTRLSEFRSTVPLHALAAMLGAAALANLTLLLGLGAPSPVIGSAVLIASLIAAIPAAAMVTVVLLLNVSRNEAATMADLRKLRYLADMDVLTRFANRRHFQELATTTLARIQADQASVMVFDIDHFKRINDMFGHAAGDDALRQVAKCLRDTLRDEDVAGRVGGDAFAVLLPQTLVKGAMSAATRIVANLGAYQVAPRIAPLSLSFGIVQMYENEVIPDAMRRAEQALHEAKRQGRSRVVVATGTSEKPVFTNSRTLSLLSA